MTNYNSYDFVAPEDFLALLLLIPLGLYLELLARDEDLYYGELWRKECEELARESEIN